VAGLAQQERGRVNNNSSSSVGMAEVLSANPVLSEDILREAVPGNIRKAEHFVAFLKKVVVYLKNLLMAANNVENKTPLAFLHEMYKTSALERKPLVGFL